MDKPTIGRIVHFTGPEALSNSAKVAPAIVTAVHGESCVNLTVFPDNGQVRLVTSVMHVSMGGDRSWDWPARPSHYVGEKS